MPVLCQGMGQTRASDGKQRRFARVLPDQAARFGEIALIQAVEQDARVTGGDQLRQLLFGAAGFQCRQVDQADAQISL